jgi:hypothetical protein
MAGPSEATIKSLFAVSGNCCAFPDCSQALVVMSDALPVVTGRICHIKGRRSGAKRYDSGQTEADRHGFQNLILLCGDHHTLIDADETSYTVSRLRAMKFAHEMQLSHSIDVPAFVPRLLMTASRPVDTTFNRHFALNEMTVGIRRSVVMESVHHPDAVQVLRDVRLYNKRIRTGGEDYFCLVLCLAVRPASQGVELALKVPLNLIPFDVFQPLDLLMHLTVRFGVPLRVGYEVKPTQWGNERWIIDRDMGRIEALPRVWYDSHDWEMRGQYILQCSFTETFRGRVRCVLAFSIDMRKYLPWVRSAD